MSKNIKFWFLLCLLAPIFSIQGAVIEDLFKARVEVDNQSNKEQTKALKAAFKQVLVKVSGDQTLLQNNEIKRHINNASNFLQSYLFEFNDDTTLYVANFNPQRVENAIRAAGYPVWGKRRPDTLVWFAIEDKNTRQRRMVAESDHPEVVQMVANQAKARGIVVDFPILDLNDIQNISVYDVWGSNAQAILAASERYNVDMLLSARIYFQGDMYNSSRSTHEQLNENNDGSAVNLDELSELPEQKFLPPTVTKTNVWVGQWFVLHRGDIKVGQVDGDTLDNVVIQMVNLLADQQAEYYAIDVNQLAEDERQAEIKIDNINNLTDYQQLTDFLSSLTVVVKATLIEIKGHQGTYQLQLLGTKTDLIEALQLDNRIKTKTDQFGQIEDPYQFVWGN